MPQEKDIISELEKTRLPRATLLEKQYFDDLVQAQLLLADETAVLEQLKKLEAALKEKIKVKPKTVNDLPGNLLNGTLGEFEIDQGFSVYKIDEKIKVILLTGNLSSEGFGKTLAEGRPFKDYVGSEHGIHTHRIHWYCFSKVARTSPLVDLYKHLGTYPKGEGWQATWRDAWYVTFDRQKESLNNGQGLKLDLESPTDFRRPENLNKYLQERGPLKGLSLLSLCLQKFHKGDQLDQHIKYLLILRYRFDYEPEGGWKKDWKRMDKKDLIAEYKKAEIKLGKAKWQEFEAYRRGDTDDANKHLFFPQQQGGQGAVETVKPFQK